MNQPLYEADEYVLGRAEVREAGDFLAVAMAERCRPLRDPQVALWDRAAHAAHALLVGDRDVGEAIDEIVRLSCKAQHQLPDGRHDELATDFELLRIDWDESPVRRHGTAISAEQACHRLLIAVKPIGVTHV